VNLRLDRSFALFLFGDRELGDPILGFRRRIGRITKKPQKAIAFCIPGVLLEKCGGGFYDTNLLGDGCGNPLVQGKRLPSRGVGRPF
jgi:hypothetical protein